jgi:hypothetical protein
MSWRPLRMLAPLAIERACNADLSHHLAGSDPNHEETGMAEANPSIQQTTTTAQARANSALKTSATSPSALLAPRED